MNIDTVRLQFFLPKVHKLAWIFHPCERFNVIERLNIAFVANGKRQTANVNLYHVTKFSIYLWFTAYYNYTKIGRFTPIPSVRIVSFKILITHYSFWQFLNLNLTFAVCRKRDHAWSL